jgi:hypothetical protein
MRTLAHPYEFAPQSWDELARESENEMYSYARPIIESIRHSNVTDQLAGALWQGGLAVAVVPISGPPIELLRVSALGPGIVRILHQTHTGKNDEIDRPASDAVALFWRFAIEKFGVKPG